MNDAPTVIARFLGHIASELEGRGASGAARNTMRAASTLEPVGRASRDDAERRRLLLLADRAARVWIRAAADLLRDDTVTEVSRQVPRVRSASAAADAAAVIHELRRLITSRPHTARPTLPADVAAALAEIELALRRAAEVEEKGAAATAVVMLPHAARGLILTFFAGAGMEGLPTETATVVRILDALDDELRAEWGENAMERTAAGSRVHRTLVESLASTLAGRSGTLTHADGLGTLPEPPRVGRHQPDLAGRAPDGSAFIGEAKLGPELFDIHSQEQLADFSTYAPDGERCALHLIVPAGWRDAGERAMITAAGRMYDAVTIHELGGIPGAPLPPAA